MMVTIRVKFVPSKISDNWLVDKVDLEEQLKKIMPNVRGYVIIGFRNHKHYRIEDIAGCYDGELPDNNIDGFNLIELNVIPKNI